MKKVIIYTLGCKVNQYESQALLELFEKRGFSPVDKDADVCIVNTCAVTAESERKARQTVRRAVRENPDAYVMVTGCASQLAPEKYASIEGVDYVNGNREKSSLPDLLDYYLENGEKVSGYHSPDLKEFGYEELSVSRSERTRAYMKVQDGCESNCSYCIIAKARGPVCSRLPMDAKREAEILVRKGYKEIVLTGIEISAYGRDLKTVKLPDLLKTISEIENLERIRLSSVDPAYLKHDLVDELARMPKVAHHFHLSLQSCSDRTLRNMRRRYNVKMLREYLDYLLEKMPDTKFTADVIVGFPGETEEEFEETCAFVKTLPLLHIHVFPFSPRPGTDAAKMEGQISKEEKSRRVSVLTAISEEIRNETLKKEIGNTVSVLFESEKNGYIYGHTGNFLEVAVKNEGVSHNSIHSVLLEREEEGVLFGSLQKEENTEQEK